MTDARGVPLVAHVTAANVNDITHLDALVADLPAARGIVAIFGRRRTSHGSGLGVFPLGRRAHARLAPPVSYPSPFAMNATTASITPSSRWGAR